MKVRCISNLMHEGKRIPKGSVIDLDGAKVAALGHFVEVIPEPTKAPKGKAAEKPEPADPVYLKPLAAEKPE